MLATVHAGGPDTLLEFLLGGIHDVGVGLDGRVRLGVASDGVEVASGFEAKLRGSGLGDGQAEKVLSEVHFGKW